MPTVKLTISKKFDRNEKENLALELTALVAKEIGKPETRRLSRMMRSFHSAATFWLRRHSLSS